MKKTHRGFKVYGEIEDMYGGKVRIQQSSNVDGGIWIFCENPRMKDDPTPHLSKTQTRRVVKALNKYLEDKEAF